MYLLNYLYFLVITILGFVWLTSSGGYMKNPLNKEQMMRMSGPEMFWVLTFGTGLLALSAPAGLDLMAIRLLVLEVFCLIGLFITKQKPQWNVASIIYAAYLVWLIIGLTYSPAPAYGIRVILKYLYPLVIMLFASAVVRNKEVFIKASLVARVVAFVSLIINVTYLERYIAPGVFWYGTARAINYISICMFSLALFYYTDEKKKNAFYTVLFMLPCFLWVFRTSIMGTGIALMTFAFLKYKAKSLPMIFGMLVCGAILVFTVPSLREKMFVSDSVTIEDLQSGQLSKDDINSNARYALWEHLEDKFYKGNELTGSGIGSVQNYMYNNFVFGGLQVPHGDFVQMKCDSGLIGLIIYIVLILSVVIHTFSVFNSTCDSAVKMCAIVAGSSMLGVFATLYSDNVVNYSMATLSMPFGFYGMMLGLQKGVRK